MTCSWWKPINSGSFFQLMTYSTTSWGCRQFKSMVTKPLFSWMNVPLSHLHPQWQFLKNLVRWQLFRFLRSSPKCFFLLFFKTLPRLMNSLDHFSTWKLLGRSIVNRSKLWLSTAGPRDISVQHLFWRIMARSGLLTIVVLLGDLLFFWEGGV